MSLAGAIKGFFMMESEAIDKAAETAFVNLKCMDTAATPHPGAHMGAISATDAPPGSNRPPITSEVPPPLGPVQGRGALQWHVTSHGNFPVPSNGMLHPTVEMSALDDAESSLVKWASVVQHCARAYLLCALADSIALVQHQKRCCRHLQIRQNLHSDP